MGSVATAPEIPQLSNPSMEPELAIVVVETGKAPGARVEARNLRIRVTRIGSQHVDSRAEPQYPLALDTGRYFVKSV